MTQITRNPNYSDSYDFTIKSPSTEPAIQAQLTDGNGDPVKLSGATTQFRMAEPDGPIVVDGAATVQDPEDGLVVYFWDDGDTDTPGIYNAEFAVDYQGRSGSNFVAEEFFPTSQYLTVHIEESL
jgi:hypothetical protein